MRAWQNFIILACAFSKLFRSQTNFQRGCFFSSLYIALLRTLQWANQNSNFDLLTTLAWTYICMQERDKKKHISQPATAVFWKFGRHIWCTNLARFWTATLRSFDSSYRYMGNIFWRSQCNGGKILTLLLLLRERNCSCRSCFATATRTFLQSLPKFQTISFWATINRELGGEVSGCGQDFLASRWNEL
jgi:hypothetical protein